MSWDIFIQQFPAGASRVAEIPDTFIAPPIGHRDDVIARIRSVLPQADFSDPAWGVLRGSDYVIEIGTGDDEMLYGITLHVRGSDEVLSYIESILRELNLRAIDSWTGEFFDPASAPQSLARWRSYIEEEV
jgi:hypothetical protein